MIIRRAFELKPDGVQEYFKVLLDADLLRHRLSDIQNPTVDQAILNVTKHTYCVLEDGIIAEFALEGFTGRSAQCHFSMHPDNDAVKNKEISHFIHNEILNVWKRDDGFPYLDSLYGIQSVKNRAGCLFALRMGFKKLGIIESACHSDGEVTDGMLSTMSRRDLNG